MNFEFQLNSNDYEEASLAELERASQAERRTIHNLALLIGLFFLLMGIISKENGFLVVGVFLVAMPVLCKIFVKTGVEIEMPIANSTNCGEPMTVEVIGEGLALNTPSWQGTFKWEAFKIFIETRNLLVIYPVSSVYPVSSSKFIIVPKRAFSAEDKLWNFRELLHKNIRKSRYNYSNKMQNSRD
ncbi:MAG TPA: hypothetical protein DCS91_12100 [Microcoleaceae bacterium UBA11344]|nr:hypothetical protein [Microcoleaceae cyanobacterium UBA11344]